MMRKAVFFSVTTLLSRSLRTVRPASCKLFHSLPPSSTPTQIPIPSSIIHTPSSPNAVLLSSYSDDEHEVMNEFLSRFVAAIRPDLVVAFPSLPRADIDHMLLLVTRSLLSKMEPSPDEPPIELSDDLWRRIHEVSASVHDAMRRDRRRIELKKYLHCDDVKEMCRFAGEIGVRGPMLRELRFKWAREKLEEFEFYRELDRLKGEGNKQDEDDKQEISHGSENETMTLPERKGSFKYKIYGLDLSDPEWKEVAEKAEEAESKFVPQEAQPVEGKCKMVEEKLLSLEVSKVDPVPVLAEWKELLGPRRADWLALLDRIREHNQELYLKVAEHLLSEKSFETCIRDYSKLIDLHSKANRLDDTKRILQKMTEKGILPDALTYISLLHMYIKEGNILLMEDAFAQLKAAGFRPDLKIYSAVFSAYIKAGRPKDAEGLMFGMKNKPMEPTCDMYLELLHGFAKQGDIHGAQRIMGEMQYAGFQPTLESYALLIEACVETKDPDPDQARWHFDSMMRSHRPDDRCTAAMISAYMNGNLLDKALNLLLTLEKDHSFQPGVATYSILLDWMARLQCVEEAEQIVKKITAMDDLPFEAHVSLCDMYSRAGQKEKVQKSLRILEGRKKLLKADQFGRIVNGLRAGGFMEDAEKMHKAMQAQGFTHPEPPNFAPSSTQLRPFPRRSRSRSRW